MNKFTKIGLHIMGMSAISFAATSSTYAYDIDDSIENYGITSEITQVADSTLASMRGRFVDSGAVQYFGLEMVSYWLTPNGGSVSAGAAVSANLKDPNNPIVQYGNFAVTNTNGSVLPNNPNQSINSPNGLINVNGLTQGIQVAGSYNTASNELNLNIQGPDSPTPSGFSNNQYTLSNQAFGTQIATDSSGAIAQAVANGQQFMTELTIPGQGTVMQFLNHTGFGVSGMGQSIALTSNNNTVKNVLDLNVQLNKQSAINNASAQATQLLQRLAKP